VFLSVTQLMSTSALAFRARIEGAKDGSVVMAPGAEQIKGGEATLINHDSLAVDEAGARFELRHCLDDLREVAGIVPTKIARFRLPP
jgi:hypothetical protein